jgi:type III secretion protein J
MHRSRSLLIFALLLLVILAGCSRQLESGLTEKEAQEIVVTLGRNGIEASTEMAVGDKKGDSNWQVTVKGGSDKVIAAWNILHESGLPREKVKGLDDAFTNSGMIPTAGEEKARLLTGLSGELTRMLNSISGVVDTHVQIVLPDNSPLLEPNERVPTTAAVLVRYRGAQPPLKEDEIKRLVAKGVEGLNPDGVAVLLKREEDKALPPRMYGPLEANELLIVVALSFGCITGCGSLVLLTISKRRSARIKKLETQLAEVNGQQSKQIGAAAQA